MDKREELILTNVEANSGIQKELIWAKTGGAYSEENGKSLLGARPVYCALKQHELIGFKIAGLFYS